jgi:hypothetical protein
MSLTRERLPSDDNSVERDTEPLTFHKTHGVGRILTFCDIIKVRQSQTYPKSEKF